MSEVRRRVTRKGKVIDAELADRGPGCTYEQVVRALERAGLQPCHEQTFWARRRLMFPDHKAQRQETPVTTQDATQTNGRPRAETLALLNGQPLPDRPGAVPLDWLRKLVRFAAVVEDVGGVDEAQCLLDGLKQLGRGLK